MSSSACQQLQSSSAIVDRELINWGQEQLEKCQVLGEPKGEDQKELLCCSEIEAQRRSAVIPWVAGLSLVSGFLRNNEKKLALCPSHLLYQ